MTKKGKKTRRKLNKKRFYSFLLIFLFIVIFCYRLFTVQITNIYISGNEFFKDQEIIDLAHLNNYPKSINNLSYDIENKLKKNIYILDAKVSKSNLLSCVHIKIKENYPLFYYKTQDSTILYDGSLVSTKFSVPTIINQIPNTVYDKLLKNMKKVNKNILSRISEIEYLPNDVDSERFFMIMNDGNYVYLTLNKFLTINKYLDMIKSFDNKKGILYLDSGVYFDIFDD